MIFGVIICVSLSLLWFESESVLATMPKADKVVVIKDKRLLMLLKDGELFRTYKIALGKQPKGHKIKAGDQRTPEGSYILDSRNPRSKYFLAIHISYPNESDIRNAQRQGVSPGGGIMIHGMPERLDRVGKLNGSTDWTDGCIAVNNVEMEEIWQFVPVGTPIEIKP